MSQNIYFEETSVLKIQAELEKHNVHQKLWKKFRISTTS